MAVSISDLRERFPGVFDATPDATLTRVLAEAVRRISASYFGETADDATLYLAAHLASAGQGLGGGGGVVQSATVGGVAVTYAAPAVSASDLSSSAYGRLYLDLLESRHPGVGVAL